MHPRQVPPPQLLSLAAHQGGLLLTEQISHFGLSRFTVQRLVAEGRWRRVCQGLLHTHDQPPDWSALTWGGVLLGGPTSRIAGLAAAKLWKLQDQQPEEIAVLIPRGRQVRDRAGYVFRQEQPGLRGRSTGEPPRLGLVDTVIDRCNELGVDAAMSLMLHAVQSLRLSPRVLRLGIEQRARVRHRQLLLDVLADARTGAETPLELHYLRDVERAHGLPLGRRQARNAAGHIRDVRYDAYGLVVELDGRIGHTGMGRFRDMARDNRAVMDGETTLRYGWFDVTTTCCGVAVQVTSVLLDRGWPGPPHRCQRCRSVPNHHWVNL